jgi:acyl-CoA thioesterase FadM
MNLILRLLVVLFSSWFRPRLHVLDESVLTLRVWPTDLDLNGHMNNGRYLTVMDLGRFDLIIRTGLGRVVARRRWSPLVASATIRFRKSLRPFARYQLRSRIVCWDEKWFFLEQRFERVGELVATGLVKGLFRGACGSVPSADVLDALSLAVPSPAMPTFIRLWREAEVELVEPRHDD